MIKINKLEDNAVDTPPRFKAGDLLVDPLRNQVVYQNQPIVLPELSYQLLLALISRWPNTVTQDELIATVWQKVQVQASTLGQRVKLLRQSLREAGCDPGCIALVRGRGYRFAWDVTAQAQSLQKPMDNFERWFKPAVLACCLLLVSALGYRYFIQPTSAQQSAVVAPDQMSVTFVPFAAENFKQATDEYIVHGFNREVRNLFREIQEIRLVTQSVDTADDINHQAMGAQFNTRYVLTGNMQKTAETFLVEAKLLATQDGSVSWSERFSVGADGLYHLKYRIGEKIQAHLKPGSHAQLLLQTDPNLINPRAYDLYLKAMNYHRRNTVKDSQHALALVSDAYQISPACAAVIAGYAEVLHKGVELGSVDQEKLDFARTLSTKITTSYPQLALGYQLLATNDLMSGNLEQAEKHYRKALKLSSNDVGTLIGLSKVQIINRQFAQAEQNIRSIALLDPSSTQSMLLSAQLMLKKGKVSEAKQAWLAVLRVEPDNSEAQAALSAITKI